jgi:hypothetical protein
LGYGGEEEEEHVFSLDVRDDYFECWAAPGGEENSGRPKLFGVTNNSKTKKNKIRQQIKPFISFLTEEKMSSSP